MILSGNLPRPRLLARLAAARAALAPHWAALLALALFLIAGLAVFDDYGVTTDESYHRGVFLSKITQLQGEHADIPTEHDNFYGGAFQFPLLFAEPVFGLRDARDIYLSRHLLTHLFFLVGGLFAYLLGRRLFQNGLLALFATLAFLLHPRLYAHSFFNAQDIPFAVMFVVALYLIHRAFRRGSVAAFVLLGVGVGVLLNLRIMGVVLLAAIPALRALDFAFAPSWAERKRVLLTTGAFVLSSAVAIYALLPYLWGNLLARAVEWWTLLSDHPSTPSALFRGTFYRSTDYPPEYLPVWFSITSPPFALLLGCVGGALILFRAAKAPREALGNTRLRFGLLLLGGFALPALSVIFLDANIYTGWRHMHFLWAPFSLMAAFGAWGLVSALRFARLRTAGYAAAATAVEMALIHPNQQASFNFFTDRVTPERLRTAVYGAAGAGLAATLISMALIHPNQQVYFNFSVDRVTPEYLRTQYVMEYWRHPMLQALLWLSDNADVLSDKAGAITGNANWETDVNAAFLPDAAKARLAETTSFTRVWPWPWESWSRSDRAAHRVKVYDNTILAIERKDDPQAVYAAARGREPGDVAGVYDVHRLDDAVALVMEPCAPAFIEHVGATLRATPTDPGDLPPWREGKREEPRGFSLAEYGAFFDGTCVASLPLPDYPIAEFVVVLSPELPPRAEARESMRRAKENGLPLARSAYDVYLAGGELVYVQEPCDPLDTEHSFRVSVFPQRAGDLPEEWRQRGHQRFWFAFHQRGALLEDGACVALFPLPDYPIAAIRTAQYVEGGDDLWEATFSANPERYQAAYRAVAGSEPVARATFDLYLLDGDLVYVKEPCAQADTEARFFLHVVPERASDLPEARRGAGFDNLDFRFFLNGARFDGRCAARVPLPPYPISSVRTGQFASAGEIWSAGFAVRR